jgi:hypothetical protein
MAPSTSDCLYAIPPRAKNRHAQLMALKGECDEARGVGPFDVGQMNGPHPLFQ